MVKRTIIAGLVSMAALTAAVAAAEPQSILRAFAPAGSEGTSVILQVDWEQVKKALPEVSYVSLRRRPAGPPVRIEKIAILPVDQSRYLDTALDASVAYHYYAYFKDADSTMLNFGSYPAVVHLGPLHTTSGH